MREKFSFRLKQTVGDRPDVWCVTGAAGFIGSHIVESLLRCGQFVVGLDNLSTGSEENLLAIRESVGSKAWASFRFIKGDIRDSDACMEATKDADFVLHQAALTSVPASLANPADYLSTNVDGFVKLIEAARLQGVRRFVYASSSAVYGDDVSPIKHEDRTGIVLSPYALSKSLNEEIARSYQHFFGFESVGLRYFNVFGPRQSESGPYAAVIPIWINALLFGKPIEIFGSGNASRDFCSVKKVVEANLLAATGDGVSATAVNIGCGHSISLLELRQCLLDAFRELEFPVERVQTIFSDPRLGDILHSRADITRAQSLFGFEPSFDLKKNLKETILFFMNKGTHVGAKFS